MNPLTLVKRIQNINAKEAALGISEDASWHAKYKDSAYVYVGGIPFDLTEGDLLAVFAQYGEIVDVNLVRDKATGKSKGSAFVAYEDQRSTNLAVDNLNGAQILGRTIRVDHVSKYKKKEEEDEETEQRKREERGVCRAFQKGECNRGAGCKFSHDERRAANTGWGHEEDRRSRWVQDKFEGSTRSGRQPGLASCVPESPSQEGRRVDKESKTSRAKAANMDSEGQYDYGEPDSREGSRRGYEKRLEQKDKYIRHRDDRDESHEIRLRRRDNEPKSRNNQDGRDEKRSRKYESESYYGDDRDSRSRDKRSSRDQESSPKGHKTSCEDHQHRSHK